MTKKEHKHTEYTQPTTQPLTQPGTQPTQPTQPETADNAPDKGDSIGDTNLQTGDRLGDTEFATGDNSPAVAVLELPAEATRVRETRLDATNRWYAEGIRSEVEEYRARIRDEAKARGVGRYEANEIAWESALAKYPPPGVKPSDPLADPGGQNVLTAQTLQNKVFSESARVAGLGDIPTSWGDLPSNASLAAEIGWVQANRLRVVEELPTGAVRVHLDRALSPAPSHAALGWLETSIRSYAKYVDVAARAASTVQDEQAMVTRERMRIEEVRELLGQMRRARDRRPPENDPHPPGTRGAPA